MFVGVGASRVRDLFEQAKQRAPCIIFIDELDAIGKRATGAAGFAANEEREQTLDQLLVEMDGFDGGTGLVSWRRPTVPNPRPRPLARGSLRPPGRHRPTGLARARGHPQGARSQGAACPPRSTSRPSPDARPAWWGPNLANAVNEAALASVRRGGNVVTMTDFEEAIDRIQLGLKKEGRVMTDDEKRRVAVHETGHALVAMTVEHADPVHRVTIIPRSVGALGATLQLPTEERYLMSRDELKDRICVLLGGRSAEEVSGRGTSTGAEDDLERATELARAMVCRFGMSDSLGPVTWRRDSAMRFMTGPSAEAGVRDISEETARAIDAEIRLLVETQHKRAHDILESRLAALKAIADELLVHETLEGSRLRQIADENSGLHAMAS